MFWIEIEEEADIYIFWSTQLLFDYWWDWLCFQSIAISGNYYWYCLVNCNPNSTLKIPLEPSEYLKILSFIYVVRFVINQTAEHPKTLIQCSDGSGRCGVFLAAFKVLKDMGRIQQHQHQHAFRENNFNRSSSQSVNITKIVYDMRKYRAEMVRCQQHYRFLYVTISECIRMANSYFNDIDFLKSIKEFGLYDQFKSIECFKTQNW